MLVSQWEFYVYILPARVFPCRVLFLIKRYSSSRPSLVTPAPTLWSVRAMMRFENDFTRSPSCALYWRWSPWHCASRMDSVRSKVLKSYRSRHGPCTQRAAPTNAVDYVLTTCYGVHGDRLWPGVRTRTDGEATARIFPQLRSPMREFKCILSVSAYGCVTCGKVGKGSKWDWIGKMSFPSSVRGIIWVAREDLDEFKYKNGFNFLLGRLERKLLAYQTF